MKKPISNNLIIELHIPDLSVAKDFYSKLGFEITMDDSPNEKDPGYLTMTLMDKLGNTMLNFYGGDDRVYNQSYFKKFPINTIRGYATEITICVANIEETYQKVCNQLKQYIV